MSDWSPIYYADMQETVQTGESLQSPPADSQRVSQVRL